jgi:hydroxymethylpyrimidine pyrophosphatase-like HAD family hydrolase
MRYLVLAADFDGTIARDGKVAPATVAALERLAATGRKLVLVTGRELDELFAIFPEIGVFHRVVAENGALLYNPATRAARVLGAPPPPTFVQELERRGVAPLSVGESIVATVEPNERIVLDAIRDLGLEMQVIFNKGAVMVLPASVNKASGLKAALAELGLSVRNVVAIGDAENDHALLREAEYGVAVANAIPTLKEKADRISALEAGDAVAELIEDLIAHDLAQTPRRAPRRRLLVGTRDDGVMVHLPTAGYSVVVAGPSGSGKSMVATGLLERAAAAGYQLCAIDPEGHYAAIGDAIAFGTAERPPTAEEVFTALEKPDANVIVSFVGMAVRDRAPFFAGLIPRLVELRARTGRPHWILVAEAHHLLPRDGAAAKSLLAAERRGFIYVTAHPESVAPAVLSSADVALAMGAETGATLGKVATAAGVAAPAVDGVRIEAGEALMWVRSRREAPFRIRVAPSEVESRRERRKRVAGELPPDRSFYFRGPDGKLNLRAQNLALFLQIAEGVDERTWLHHLGQGDYSRWLRESMNDDALAARVAEVERAHNLASQETRARVRAAIEERYALPTDSAIDR